jgi:hypothetical protein
MKLSRNLGNFIFEELSHGHGHGYSHGTRVTIPNTGNEQYDSMARFHDTLREKII